jgi:hypothetical protein
MATNGTRQRDAIAILKADHREVEQLFKAFEKTSAAAVAERKHIVDGVVEKLSVHAAIEEQIIYPWARAHTVDEDDRVLEAFEEHRLVKFLLSELSLMSADDERFEAKTTVLTELVRHHVKEEESELFLDLRDVATRAELLDLGRQLEAAKKTAATSPDLEGFIPAIGSGVGAAIDHARDVGRGVVSKVGALTGLD